MFFNHDSKMVPWLSPIHKVGNNTDTEVLFLNSEKNIVSKDKTKK